MDRDYDALFRIMILGDTGVGKTCLLQRFCDNEFRYSHVCTIGIDFKMKTMVVNGVRVRIQIWDTAGQERYRSITRQYFKKAQGIILAYDITDETSFTNFGDEDVSVILVANKNDREDGREVTSEAGKELADELSIAFHEVSAYTSENVAEMFGSVTSLVLQRFEGAIASTAAQKKRTHSSDTDDTADDEETVENLKSENADTSTDAQPGYSCCSIL